MGYIPLFMFRGQFSSNYEHSLDNVKVVLSIFIYVLWYLNTLSCILCVLSHDQCYCVLKVLDIRATLDTHIGDKRYLTRDKVVVHFREVSIKVARQSVGSTKEKHRYMILISPSIRFGHGQEI